MPLRQAPDHHAQRGKGRRQEAHRHRREEGQPESGQLIDGRHGAQNERERRADQSLWMQDGGGARCAAPRGQACAATPSSSAPGSPAFRRL